jgi:uncharacterized FAD-dependent dehydrogenase
VALRVTNLRVGLNDPDSALPERISQAIGLPVDGFRHRILRKSLDTRDKRDIHFVYSIEVVPLDAADRPKSRIAGVRVETFVEEPFTLPDPGRKPLVGRPVVIGSGPGGLAAAYFLAEMGYHPLLLERGRAVTQRIRDVQAFDAGGRFEPTSNYLFGEGGAGTFSDGKLTCRSTGPDVLRILELFAECKGKPSILYEHRPHLGSNRLPAVVKAMRRQIEALGGEVRFDCPVVDLLINDGVIVGVLTPSGPIRASAVILAIGHSARDTFAMLHRRGVALEQKPFQMGLRVEHPQELVNRVQYGPASLERQLGNADYSLVAHGTNDVFTFCMCAGGFIIPSVSDEKYFCTNGMSLSKRDSFFANSGLVVTVPLSAFEGTDPLAGVRLQERYERVAFEMSGFEYRCPAQRATDFMNGQVSHSIDRCSYPRGLVMAKLDEVVPPIVAEALRNGLPQMDRRWRGRFLPEAVLVGPEARGSSPVRLPRHPLTRESSNVAGLFPVGEGAGYAGGIVSAAVDGLRTAKAVIAKHARPK